MATPQLVVLPGMDGTGTLHQPLLDALAALEPSLATTVLSYPGTQALGYRELEELIRPRLPTSPFVLLGESFSGPLAISIAASRPPGLRGVILCCTFARNPRPALAVFSRLIDSWVLGHIAPHRLTPVVQPFLLGQFSSPGLVASLANALRQVKPQVMARRALEVLRINVLDKLAAIPVPVMYLQARQDRVVPRKSAVLMLGSLPAMKIIAIDGPHCLLQASPGPSAQSIVDFCNGLELQAP